MAHYLIGIDLGTTNSALAYIDLRGAKGKSSQAGPPAIRHFPIPQLVAAGEVAPRELLPSFLYLPGAHDLPPGSVAFGPFELDHISAPVGERGRTGRHEPVLREVENLDPSER